MLSSHDGVRAMMLNVPWCQNCTRKELDALAFAFKPSVFSTGDTLIKQGSQTGALHLVVSGSIRLSKKVGEGKASRAIT